MKYKLLSISLLTLVLGGCTYGVEIGPIELHPSQNGNIQPLTKTTSPVTNIYIQYQDGFEVKTAVADFQPKGIIEGQRSPLIPLDEEDSHLHALGFITHISNDGQKATLQYNDSVIQLAVGDPTLFIDDKPGYNMGETPIYNNATIYIPIIPLLDVLKIDYEVVGTDLTIGGKYTDDSGEPVDTRTVEPTEQPVE